MGLLRNSILLLTVSVSNSGCHCQAGGSTKMLYGVMVISLFSSSVFFNFSFSQVAQLVNHRLCNREVAGSNPTACLVVG